MHLYMMILHDSFVYKLYTSIYYSFDIYMTWFDGPMCIWMIIVYACDFYDVDTDIVMQDVCDVMLPMIYI